MALPRYAVFQSLDTKKNVVYIDEVGENNGLLSCTGDQVVSPLAKLALERAKTRPGHVHIRSCYNNKLWTRTSEDKFLIAARANEIEEDPKKWNCTMFKPLILSSDTDDQIEKIGFVHSQSNLRVIVNLSNETPKFPLIAQDLIQTKDDPSLTAFKLIDWESLSILPKFVAFKGDNENYLQGIWSYDEPYLQFSQNDYAAQSTMNEIFSNPDGSIRIKTPFFGKFWRNSGNWIKVDAEEDCAKTDPNCHFWPISLRENIVALRNLGNNAFCKRLSLEGKDNLINAYVSTMTIETQLEVKEQVHSRSIYNVDYRLNDVRSYNDQIKTMTLNTVVNNTSKDNTYRVKFHYTKHTITTWSSNVSLKLRTEAKLTAGVPGFVDGELTVESEFNANYEWGKTNDETEDVDIFLDVPVKAKTRLKAYLVASLVTCDIPFSYTQRETLIDGTQKIHRMHDGVFTGVSAYKFKAVTGNEEPLTGEQSLAETATDAAVAVAETATDAAVGVAEAATDVVGGLFKSVF